MVQECLLGWLRHMRGRTAASESPCSPPTLLAVTGVRTKRHGVTRGTSNPYSLAVTAGPRWHKGRDVFAMLVVMARLSRRALLAPHEVPQEGLPSLWSLSFHHTAASEQFLDWALGVLETTYRLRAWGQSLVKRRTRVVLSPGRCGASAAWHGWQLYRKIYRLSSSLWPRCCKHIEASTSKAGAGAHRSSTLLQTKNNKNE